MKCCFKTATAAASMLNCLAAAWLVIAISIPSSRFLLLSQLKRTLIDYLVLRPTENGLDWSFARWTSKITILRSHWSSLTARSVSEAHVLLCNLYLHFVWIFLMSDMCSQRSNHHVIPLIAHLLHWLSRHPARSELWFQPSLTPFGINLNGCCELGLFHPQVFSLSSAPQAQWKQNLLGYREESGVI